jgi:hypothetical protein
LFGQPNVDTSTNTLTVANLDYSVETRNLLVNFADWVLHSHLRDDLQRKAQFPFSDYVQTAKTKLANYEDKKVGIADLQIQTSNVALSSLFFTKDAAHETVLLKGRANIKVQ